jgi:hypothetical protein
MTQSGITDPSIQSGLNGMDEMLVVLRCVALFNSDD